MIELNALQLLVSQTLLFSASVTLVGLLRPLLVRGLDVGAGYLAWLLITLVMLAPALSTPIEGQVLPIPALMVDQAVHDWMQEPLALEPMAQAASTASPAAMLSLSPALPQRPDLPGIVTLSLAVWVLGVLAQRQHRYAARLKRGEEAWHAPAGDSPLHVQMSLIGMDPRSAQFATLRENERAARTPQQLAESARLNEEFRRQQEARDAQDRAWRLARGEQP